MGVGVRVGFSGVEGETVGQTNGVVTGDPERGTEVPKVGSHPVLR